MYIRRLRQHTKLPSQKAYTYNEILLDVSIGFYACPYVYSLYPECFITPLKIPLYTSVEQLASSVSLLELLKWDHSFGQVNANEDGLSLDLKLNCQFRINLIITRIAKHFKQCLVQRSKKRFRLDDFGNCWCCLWAPKRVSFDFGGAHMRLKIIFEMIGSII